MINRQGQSSEQKIEKRKQLKIRYENFVLKVIIADKKFFHEGKQFLRQYPNEFAPIIEEFYRFLLDFGYVFFFNIFINQPKDHDKESPIVIKVMKLFTQLLKTISEHGFDTQIWSICDMIESYCKHQVPDMLDEARRETHLKDKSSYHHLSQMIHDIKQLIESKQKSPHNFLQPISPERSDKFLKLAPEIIEMIRKQKANQQTYTSYRNYFLESAASILAVQPQNFLEERLLNHYKEIAQLSLKSGDSNLPHCCSIFVRHQESYYKQESKYHEHKNYHWPIEMDSIVKHVKKTLVGFLNSDGGIIYIGMKENPDQVVSVGISLSDQEVVAFFQWLHMLCGSIYPDLSQDKEQDYEEMFRLQLGRLKQRAILEKGSLYRVNKYVAVEYLSVIDPKTYEDFYKETPEKQLKRVYLIRIRIEAGSKVETYHLLKEEKKGEIEAFMRKDATVNKLSLEEFFKLYNERFTEYLQGPAVSEKVKEHQCPKVHFSF